MKVIPTAAHGMLDYLTAGTLLALPAVLPMPARVSAFLRGAGLMTLGYSLLTNYELGALRLLPMPAHLAVDGMSAAGFLAAPWLLHTSEKGLSALLIGLGLFEAMATALSDPTPSYERHAVGESSYKLEHAAAR